MGSISRSKARVSRGRAGWAGAVLLVVGAVGPLAACGGSDGTASTGDDGAAPDGSLAEGAAGDDSPVGAAETGADHAAPDSSDGALVEASGSMESSVESGGDGSGEAAANDSGATDGGSSDAGDAAASVCVEGSRGGSGLATWANGFGAGGTVDETRVAVDAQGNIFAFGDFQGTIDFTGGDGGAGSLTSAGLKDLYLAKFDPGGRLLWSSRYGNAATQYAGGVTTDASGNVYIVGSFYSGVSFDGAADAGSYSHAYSETTGFVAKFDANGQYLWSREVGNGSGYEFLYGVAVDGLGGVAVSGSLQGTVPFAAADGGVDALTGAGANDIMVFKLTTDGAFVWARSFGDSADQASTALGVDGAGNFYLTGYAGGTIALGSAGSITTGPVMDTFLLRLGNDGTPEWGRLLTGAADLSGEQFLAVTPQGDAYVAMNSHSAVGPAGLDGGPGTVANQGNTDVAIARFDPAGNYVWGRGFGDAAAQFVGGVAVDAEGSVFVTGSFQGSLSFPAPDGGTSAVTSAGGYDAFLLKLDADGETRWSQIFGGAGDQEGTGVAVAGCTPVAAGTFTGAVSINALSGSSPVVLPASAVSGSADTYLTSLVP